MWRASSSLLVLTAVVCTLAAPPLTSQDYTTEQSGASEPAAETTSHVTSDDQETTTTTGYGGVQMVSMQVKGLVRHRYATLEVRCEMVNNGDTPAETQFVVHLPESAFISRASLEVDGQIMDGEVRERSTAQQEYQQAVDAGNSAGHVQTTSVRDSSHVRVSVNVAANSKASFNLTYEELLVRRKGRYELAVNLSPGQTVELMSVDIEIKESSNLTFVRVPPFDSSLASDGKDEDRENSAVSVDREDECCARVRLESRGAEGLPGPLLLRYDVDHSAPAGEVLLLDGFFVHFLAASPQREDEKVLPKHAVFVLDSSGSMWGRKLRQLKDAMGQILSQLRRQDVFSIVTFSTSASEWSIQGLEPAAGRGVYPANRRNVALAKEFIERMEASGATNIQSAIRRALTLASRYRNVTLAPGVSEGANYTTTPSPARPGDAEPAQPVLVFLTDGMPTAGELRLNRILSVVKHSNQAARASIFALAFGEGANFGFLRKLALQNFGFSRRIYEAADAPLQLQSFYQEVASPLLTNLTFNYVDSKVNLSSVTVRQFPTFFAGSEAVVAGRLRDAEAWHELPSPCFLGHVSAQAAGHQVLANIAVHQDDSSRKASAESKRKRPGHLERVWAFLTIRQLLDAAALDQVEDDERPLTAPTPAPPPVKDSHRARAVALALRYGFVTPVTSLVLVARNVTSGDTKKEAVVVVGGVAGDSAPVEGMNVQDKVIPATPFPHRPLLLSPGSPLSKPAESAQETWSLDSLSWLVSRLQPDDELTFPVRPEHPDDVITRTVLRNPAPQDADAVDGAACVVSAVNGTAEVTGSCRHLAACPAQINTFESFLEKFCDIHSKYAGVCCHS